MRFKLIIFFILFQFISFAQEIHYTLSMPKPQNHYFVVSMRISNIKQNELELKLPVWAPGSYLVREFSKNINLVKATDAKGNELKVDKTAKNKWLVATKGQKEITVSYEVYAFELSVRTSFLDLSHGFVSSPGVFMYIEKSKYSAGTVEVIPYKDFKTITTALKLEQQTTKNAGQLFHYETYDQLVDSPIEIGNQTVFEFTAAGTKHTVGIYGKGNYNVAQLQKDMAKICEAATSVFGSNPNKNYTFIIHNVTDGQGGLEHLNNTTLSVNRWTYEGPEYINFLSLVAHEYFHLWNVKRIRPIELGPFNYDEENYTSLLWVMEGFTSYYDELLLVRAGYITEEQYLQKLASGVNYVEGSVGARIQPVAHASFDAWIKAYRPSENSGNTTMTYYTRGTVIASLIDAMIIDHYKGEKCLDHFMQILLEKYNNKLKRGFTPKEFQDELSAFLGQDLTSFFNDYIYGTKIPDYTSLYAKLGVKAEANPVSKPGLGANLTQNGGQLTIKSIRAGSPAEEAGLSVNDEIIGCNGFRVDQADFEALISGLKVGETMSVLVARDLELLEIIVKMGTIDRPQFKISFSEDQAVAKNRKFWLRKL